MIDRKTQSRTWPFAVSLALAAAAAAVYLPGLHQKFITYDDPGYVTENHHIRNGFNAESISWAFTTGRQSNWHPLTWLSLMLDYRIGGGEPWAFKLTNLLFHAVNASLLFLVLYRMTGALWPGAIVAALFALHPLHVESVAWVSERKDVLSTFFWLATMWCYTRWLQSPKLWRYLLILAALAMGLLSKPMLVTLPFVLLLMDLWPFKRWPPAPEANGSQKGKKTVADPPRVSLRRLFIEKIPLFILASASCVITFLVQRKGGAVASMELFSFPVRLQNAIAAYAAYLGKMVWPVNLAVIYPHPGRTLPIHEVAGAVILLLLLTAICLWQGLKRDRRWLLVGWLWYLGTLVPVIGLVQVGAQAMADRYTYIPLIGPFIAITWLAGEAVNKAAIPRPVAGFASIAILGILAGLSVRQVNYWKDSITLFTHAVESVPNNYIAHGNLGVAYNEAKQYEKAIPHLQETMKFLRDDAAVHNNLGCSYMQLFQYDKALPCFEKAVLLEPQKEIYWFNLGKTLLKLQQPEKAAAAFEKTLSMNPDSAVHHQQLGQALAQLGRYDQAVKHLREAIRLDEREAEYYSDLGNVYLMKDAYSQACEQYEKAIAIQPDLMIAHNNLSVALILDGKKEQALSKARALAEKNPQNADAFCTLGTIYLQLARPEDAISAFQQALRIDPKNIPARQGMHAAQSAVPKSSP